MRFHPLILQKRSSNRSDAYPIRITIVVATSFLLHGCMVAPIVAAGAFSEGVTYMASSMSYSGKELFQMADWNDRYDKKTQMFGIGNASWSCARGGGAEICVPPDQAKESNISNKIVFDCQLGQGGAITSLVTRSNNTLFCKKRA